MEYQPKSNEKYTPILHCISSFEGTFYKKIEDTTTRSFICCCFTLVFTLEDIICRTSFNNIRKKRIFVTNFPFLTDSLKLPNPLNDQNLLSTTKVFCQCSLRYCRGPRYTSYFIKLQVAALQIE